jgi:hypothetical protein
MAIRILNGKYNGKLCRHSRLINNLKDKWIFLTGPISKSRKQKFRNGTIKVTMDSGNNIFEVTEENGYDNLDI